MPANLWSQIHYSLGGNRQNFGSVWIVGSGRASIEFHGPWSAEILHLLRLTMSDSFPSLGQSSRAFPLPSIPEDAIQYVLHQPASGSEADDIALAVLITDYVYSLLTQPWLWNKDPWELKAVGGEKLEGRMRVGDAVDDEWCVVWLLREVSKRWPELVMRFVAFLT